MPLDPRVLEDIRSIDLLAIVDIPMMLALLTLSGLVIRTTIQLGELRTKQRAHEMELGNKLATLEQVTGFDALTGLRGQRWFENALAVALRGPGPVSIIYIDLDGIKILNLAKGHQFVDGVIRNAAMAIRTSLRRSADRDMICRRGTAADEFLVILDGASLKTAVARAEQILTSLRSIGVTASIGVAVRAADRRMSAADLERAAELQMDQAKESGRNCVRPLMPLEAEIAPKRRGLLATRYRVHRRTRAVVSIPSVSSDAIPEEIAADATERVELTTRAA